jgi:predicted PurR-regulated permease PerM
MGELAASRVLYRGALFLVSFVILLLILRELTVVAMQFFAACIIAAAISPAVNAITTSRRPRRWRWRPPRALAVLFIYLVAGVALFFLGAFVVRGLVNDLALLTESLPSYTDAVATWLTDLFASMPMLAGVDVTQWVVQGLSTIVGWATGLAEGMLRLVGALMGLLGSLLNVIFILMMALYLTVDGLNMRDYLLVFVPKSRQEGVRHILTRVVQRLGQWVQGQLLLCLIVGGGAWLGLRIIGVPYASFLGLVWALAEFIPGVGPFISAIPTILLGFLVSPATGVMAALFSLVWSQAENNVITPKVLGDATEIHPLVVLVALLVGSELLGLAGALLAIPFAAVIGVLVDEIHQERLRSQLALSESVVDSEPPVPAPELVTAA